MIWVAIGVLAAISLRSRPLDRCWSATASSTPAPRSLVVLLPVPMLAALVAVGTLADGHSLQVDARLPAVAVAAVCIWRRLPFLVVILAAAATAALLRALWTPRGDGRTRRAPSPSPGRAPLPAAELVALDLLEDLDQAVAHLPGQVLVGGERVERLGEGRRQRVAERRPRPRTAASRTSAAGRAPARGRRGRRTASTRPRCGSPRSRRRAAPRPASPCRAGRVAEHREPVVEAPVDVRRREALDQHPPVGVDGRARNAVRAGVCSSTPAPNWRARSERPSAGRRVLERIRAVVVHQRDVHVQARALVVAQPAHERRQQPVARRGLLDHRLEDEVAVGHLKRLAMREVDLELPAAVLLRAAQRDRPRSRALRWISRNTPRGSDTLPTV